jgi:hypothetical protein
MELPIKVKKLPRPKLQNIQTTPVKKTKMVYTGTGMDFFKDLKHQEANKSNTILIRNHKKSFRQSLSGFSQGKTPDPVAKD